MAPRLAIADIVNRVFADAKLRGDVARGHTQAFQVPDTQHIRLGNFRAAPSYVARPQHIAAVAHIFGMRETLKIAWAIVVSLAIQVVNFQPWRDRAVECFVHKTMDTDQFRFPMMRQHRSRVSILVQVLAKLPQLAPHARRITSRNRSHVPEVGNFIDALVTKAGFVLFHTGQSSRNVPHATS